MSGVSIVDSGTHFNALNFELHVVFSGGFAVLPFLPTVAVATVSDFLPGVQEHGTTFGPEKIEIMLEHSNLSKIDPLLCLFST